MGWGFLTTPSWTIVPSLANNPEHCQLSSTLCWTSPLIIFMLSIVIVIEFMLIWSSSLKWSRFCSHLWERRGRGRPRRCWGWGPGTSQLLPCSPPCSTAQSCQHRSPFNHSMGNCKILYTVYTVHPRDTLQTTYRHPTYRHILDTLQIPYGHLTNSMMTPYGQPMNNIQTPYGHI